MASVHITKLAAAERQLRAAIRMYFDGEDDLAIHTVASAAHHLLADLKADRGMDEAADSILTSFFYAVRDYRRGTLPEYLLADHAFLAWVRNLADQLPITADSSIRDVSITLPPQAVREFWKHRRKVANFLKHADHDRHTSISLEDHDNLMLLIQCYCAYRDLTPNDLDNEGLVFEIYVGAREDNQSSCVKSQQEIVNKLRDVDESDRKRICSFIIRNMDE